MQRDPNDRGDRQDFQRALLETKSFTGSAVLTLILYILLWIPGLIANIIFLREAGRVKAQIGRAPEGNGCLTTLLWFNVVIPAIIILLIFIIAAAGS